MQPYIKHTVFQVFIGLVISLASASSVYFFMSKPQPVSMVVQKPVNDTETTTPPVVEPVEESAEQKTEKDVTQKAAVQKHIPQPNKQTPTVAKPVADKPKPVAQQDYKIVLVERLKSEIESFERLREYGDFSIDLLVQRNKSLKNKIIEIRKMEIESSDTKYENLFASYKELHQIEKESLELYIEQFKNMNAIIVGAIGEYKKSISDLQAYNQPVTLDYTKTYIANIESEDAWQHFFNALKNVNKRVTDTMTNSNNSYILAYDYIQNSLEQDDRISNSLKSAYTYTSPVQYSMPAFRNPMRCTAHTDYSTGTTQMECF